MKTGEKILRIIAGNKVTAFQIAKELNIQVSAVRKHLNRLMYKNLVNFEFIKKGVGRPRKVYFLTEKGMEALPKLYADFVNELISKIEQHDENVILRALTEIVEDLSKKFKGDIENFFNELNFMPELIQKNDKIVIISNNCPYLKIAKNNKHLICDRLHTELIKKITGKQRIELSECMAMGQIRCVHVIAN